MGRNTKTLLAVCLAVAFLGACTRTVYTSIRHPLHVGQVDQNSIPLQAGGAEQERALPPGTLTDYAVLTQLNADQICIQTNLWSLDQENPARGDYTQYGIALLNDQPGLEHTTGQVTPQAPQISTYNGRIGRRERVGRERVCTNRQRRRVNGRRTSVCVEWGWQPVFRTVYYPHVWQVTQHPADICFPNGGFVTPSTTRLALQMNPRGAGNLIFEWQFDSAVAQ